jgi:hypothetical protein
MRDHSRIALLTIPIIKLKKQIKLKKEYKIIRKLFDIMIEYKLNLR